MIESSNSSYRSRWFCLVKKDEATLRFILNLQRLNGVTLKDSAISSNVKTIAKSCDGCACYTSLNLYVAFDQRELNERSRDLTTFQTPLGTFRLTIIPMGYTNSMQIMHNDMVFILQDEISRYTNPFVDDCSTLSVRTRYELANDEYEVLKENSSIRRFIHEHICILNRILQRMKVVGGTFFEIKIIIVTNSIVFLKHRLTYMSRESNDTKVQKVRD